MAAKNNEKLEQAIAVIERYQDYLDESQGVEVPSDEECKLISTIQGMWYGEDDKFRRKIEKNINNNQM